MASDTLTEMESAASSMLKGPSSFSETWYRASAKHKERDGRVIKFALTLVPTLRSYIEKKLCVGGLLKSPINVKTMVPCAWNLPPFGQPAKRV